jgi:hypothetical protein
VTKYLYTQGFRAVCKDLDNAKCYITRCITKKAPYSVFPLQPTNFTKDHAAALAKIVLSAREVSEWGLFFMCHASHE